MYERCQLSFVNLTTTGKRTKRKFKTRRIKRIDISFDTVKNWSETYVRCFLILRRRRCLWLFSCCQGWHESYERYQCVYKPIGSLVLKNSVSVTKPRRVWTGDCKQLKQFRCLSMWMCFTAKRIVWTGLFAKSFTVIRFEALFVSFVFCFWRTVCQVSNFVEYQLKRLNDSAKW